MKLHLTQAAGNQLITGHAPEWVEVNAQRYHGSLLVLPNLLVTDWQVADFDALTVADFERIAELAPEVVLLGTGDKHRFIHPRLTTSLTARGIPVECMTTAAACRTYNILMAEDRHVAAALLVNPAAS
ncbi:Mth938-like domain-containing protein [Methylovorus glucosotrophus]|uniref:Xcc1710-like domain-containing protein n=1 Tax=Methylovorus glucosotrophus (strain SIP3-4) TaxID=582744 RepID=C6XC46_METGS|nr:Mth938-like domain-containing protein [Methylovorus glucosotrophus]ACT50121.1 protein of unknown function DUF498 [Methylovorus glucosotrophus SIP3-4]